MTRPENPFGSTGAGEQYARGRVYHHPRSLQHAVALPGATRIDRGLDVACGTGMSTRALADLAAHVVGVDRSPQMLRFAPRLPNGSYAIAEAERLPVAGSSVDTVTVCSGVHWFDQPAFFAEVRRVLRPGGAVILYDHYFVGEMVGAAGFGSWTGRVFDRYPLPPRALQVGDPRTTTPAGFEKVGEASFADDVEMGHGELVDYLLSISNLVTAMERGESAIEARRWLEETSAPYFSDASTRTVRFLGAVLVLRRAD